jgi:ABC-2 type transport system permease protein
MGSTSARYSHEVLQGFFETCGGSTIIVSVLLAMRSLAGERAAGTEQLLSGSTASEGSIVLGKYLAVMAMVVIFTALTFHMPLLVMVHGKISVAHLLVGYFGVLCVGSATVGIGIFSSSLFRYQLMAGAFSGLLVTFFIVVWFVAEITDPPFSEMLGFMAFFNKHLIPFQEGRLVTSSVIYFATTTWLFLTLATRVLANRRWQ